MSSIRIVCPQCNAINRVPSGRLGDKPRCGVCHQVLFPGVPLELTLANFSPQLRQGDLPVLVDFWAPWCGPCRMMAPVFEQAAARFATRARLAKLDTEAHPQIAGQFGIRSIPTLILFRHGEEAERMAGALSLPQLSSWIERHV